MQYQRKNTTIWVVIQVVSIDSKRKFFRVKGEKKTIFSNKSTVI